MRLDRLLVAMLCCGLVIACSRSSAPTTVPAAAPAPGPAVGKPAVAARDPSSLPWAGRPLDLSDREALIAYLDTAPAIEPTRFEVHWDSRVLAFDAGETRAAIVSMSRDGARIVLDAAVPKVADLHPGSILFLHNLALVEVQRIAREDAVVIAAVRSVPLTDAMVDADIEFTAPVSWSASIPSATARRKAAPVVPVAARFPDRDFRGGLMHVALKEEPPSPTPAAPSDSEDADAPATQQTPMQGARGFAGTFSALSNEWQWAIQFTPQGTATDVQFALSNGGEGGPSFGDLGKAHSQAAHDAGVRERADLSRELADVGALMDAMDRFSLLESNPNADARQVGALQLEIIDLREKLSLDNPPSRSALGDRAARLKRQLLAKDRPAWQEEDDKLIAAFAGKLWQTAKSNLDIRVRGQAKVSGLSALVGFKITNHVLQDTKVGFNGLKGVGTMDMIGRLGKSGQENINLPVMELPVAMNVPVPVGGIPFVVQLGADATLTISLTGLHASMHVSGAFKFGGDAGFRASGSGEAQYSDAFAGDPPVVGEFGAMSPGVSAAVLGLQIPRIGLGLGMLGASVVGYVDLVNVITITNSAAVSLGLATPPCERVKLSTSSHLGIRTEVLPFKLPLGIGEDTIRSKLSPKKTLWEKSNVIQRPPIKACDIG